MHNFHLVHAERIRVAPSFSIEVLVFSDVEFKEGDAHPAGNLAAVARTASTEPWTAIGENLPAVPQDTLDFWAKEALPKKVRVIHIGENAWLVREHDKANGPIFRFDPASPYRPVGFAAERGRVSLWDVIEVADQDLQDLPH